MIYLLVFSAVFVGLAFLLAKYAKSQTKIYTKIIAIVSFAVGIWFGYQFVYWWNVGQDIAKYWNDGAGTTYTDATTGKSTTFYSANDTQVGEYFALQRANRDVIALFSSYLPLFALLGAGYLIIYYAETALFSREGDRVT